MFIGNIWRPLATTLCCHHTISECVSGMAMCQCGKIIFSLIYSVRFRVVERRPTWLLCTIIAMYHYVRFDVYIWTRWLRWPVVRQIKCDQAQSVPELNLPVVIFIVLSMLSTTEPIVSYGSFHSIPFIHYIHYSFEHKCFNSFFLFCTINVNPFAQLDHIWLEVINCLHIIDHHMLIVFVCSCIVHSLHYISFSCIVSCPNCIFIVYMYWLQQATKQASQPVSQSFSQQENTNTPLVKLSKAHTLSIPFVHNKCHSTSS